MRAELRALRDLIEDQEHDQLVRRSDEVVDFLALVRKKLLAFQTEFKRAGSPFADYLAEMMGEMARVTRQGVVDIERSAAMLSPDD